MIVPTWREPENHAVVTGLGTAEDAEGAQILKVTRLATDEEVDAARKEMFEAEWKREADMRAWLAIAQRLAGFQPGSIDTPPDEYPFTPIPPIDETTPCHESARECGFVWRRVYRRAEENGLPDIEVEQFKRISDRWFDIAFGRPVRDL
ncbi:hypothetical protein A5735_02635 [Mycolicibacter heraklionensis]|nr:hypothetical protein A5735_02635 [Mycolicibacter heraklionensis]